MNPNLPEDQVRPAPMDSRDTFPHPSEIDPRATNSAQLSEEDYKLYSRILSEFDKESTWNEQIRSKIYKAR
jgi:hypothetical protein